MEPAIYALVGGLVGLVAGGAVIFALIRMQERRRMLAATDAASNIMKEAESTAREIVLASKDEALEMRARADQDIGRKRGDVEREQEQLNQRREKLDRRFDQAEQRARTLDGRERSLSERENKIVDSESKAREEFERIAEMTRDDAREQILAEVADDTRADAARVIRDIEAEAREMGEERARKIIVTCIQRSASDVVSENVSATVNLPADEMKGRIIGRQGRNIRAFEQATGVDVIVDDTPEAVTLSCFDPIRREVGRRALAALIEDGRIHPARIEQVVKKERDELERVITKAGEDAAYNAGVPRLHKELLHMLGRLKFRTSYGQNVLDHSVEVAHLAAMLAQEVGANADLARAGGLLHDLGKAVSHEVEGPHALVGAEIAAKFGVPPLVVNAIAAHHHEAEAESLEAILVESADAISGARPGARRESLELYVKRIKALENIALGFEGVEESFAIQAGREIRIIVRPEQIDDLAAARLSRDVARKVEETLEYPGQVKVTVIRETRAVDYAK